MVAPGIPKHIREIQALCEEAGVTRLELCEGADPFSAGAEGPACFIVTLPASVETAGWAQTLATMEARLAAILGRDVELLLPAALRNDWLRDRIGASRVELYPVGQ